MATMTLNLSDREMAVLTQISVDKGLTKTATVKQAIRLYQMIDVRLQAGERLMFSGDKGKLYEGLVLV